MTYARKKKELLRFQNTFYVFLIHILISKSYTEPNTLKCFTIFFKFLKNMIKNRSEKITNHKVIKEIYYIIL